MIKGYCGKTRLSNKMYDVSIVNNQFKLFEGNKFVKFVSNSKLRIAGIYNDENKKMYGKHGYIGSIEKQVVKKEGEKNKNARN